MNLRLDESLNFFHLVFSFFIPRRGCVLSIVILPCWLVLVFSKQNLRTLWAYAESSFFLRKISRRYTAPKYSPDGPEVIPSGILSGMFSAQAWCLLAAPALGTGDRGGKISCALRRAAVQGDADKPVTEHHHR